MTKYVPLFCMVLHDIVVVCLFMFDGMLHNIVVYDILLFVLGVKIFP